MEIKFYALVALMAFMMPDREQLGRVFGILALAMGGVWVASTIISGSGSITPQSLLKFLAIAPYLSFFAVGILGWQFQQGHFGNERLLTANLALSTLIIFVEASSPGDGYIAALVCAAVYLALTMLFVRYIRGHALPHFPGLSWAMAQVGLLSFSWYLIHENIGVSMLATFNLHMPASVALGLVIVSTFIMAVVFASLFEWRFRKPVEKAAEALLVRLTPLMEALRRRAA
ncbi:MAG: hypothetical protein GX970_07995 [Phyllobacteriaceae bacterium]|nr:hypothetical protein [Phyllobacteriaceae bacterium]